MHYPVSIQENVDFLYHTILDVQACGYDSGSCSIFRRFNVPKVRYSENMYYKARLGLVAAKNSVINFTIYNLLYT